MPRTSGYPESTLRAYGVKGKTALFPASGAKQIFLYNARATNNTGGAAKVGLGRQFALPQMRLWQYTASGPSVADVSALVSGGTAENLFTTTNNDGFVVQADRPFNLAGFTISSASAGATVTYQYYNGSSLTALTLIETPVYSSTGDITIAFRAPLDWAVGGVAGTDTSKYTILVQATTHPTTAVAANGFWVAEFLEYQEGVPNNSMVQIAFPDTKPFVFRAGEGIVAYYDTANAANQLGAFYEVR